MEDLETPSAEERAQMSTAEINDLPDSDFAYIEPGGEKDDEGKTTPRSLRHFPIHDAAHVRNALARIAQGAEFGKQALPKVKAAAEKFGIEVDPSIGDQARSVTVVHEPPEPPAAAMRAEMRGVTETRVSPRSEFELREIPNGTGGMNLRFTGFASVTNSEYEMEDFIGPWIESVSPGAFRKTLTHNADVAFLLNHSGMTLARTKPGTLKLSEVVDADSSPIPGITGLHSEALLDPTNIYVQAVRSAVDRGDLDEMSMAFRVFQQVWNEDYDRRQIKEVSLDKGDVSLVNYAASPATGGTVSLRQRLFGHGDTAEAERAARRGVADLGITPEAFVQAIREVRAGKTISQQTFDTLAPIHSNLMASADQAATDAQTLAQLLDIDADAVGDEQDDDPDGQDGDGENEPRGTSAPLSALVLPDYTSEARMRLAAVRGRR